MEFIFIILGYLLGSFPSGFIFSKLFAKKNPLEIGWRKTSASNVFRNVGVLPGILTAIFDVFKGFLAIWLTKKFEATTLTQILTGVFAVVGHNWSIFLKFAGGRGIATFLGALLAFSFRLAIFSLLPFLLLALIWNSSVGTIFFLFFVLFSLKTGNDLLWLFPALSLFPILIKRLSPIKEISFENKKLIFNRLIFDDDISKWEPRVFKILKKLRKK